MNGKGSQSRIDDQEAYAKGWERIFGKKPKWDKPTLSQKKRIASQLGLDMYLAYKSGEEWLDALEDAEDLRICKERLVDGKDTIPWEQCKKDLGLDTPH